MNWTVSVGTTEQREFNTTWLKRTLRVASPLKSYLLTYNTIVCAYNKHKQVIYCLFTLCFFATHLTPINNSWKMTEYTCFNSLGTRSVCRICFATGDNIRALTSEQITALQSLVAEVRTVYILIRPQIIKDAS